MSAGCVPARDGRYLRVLDCGEAWSWWRKGRWYTSEFWSTESPEQHAPWRGGVLGDVSAWMASQQRLVAVPRRA